MIHFVFSEKDNRYLFLKFDNDDDDKWLRPNNNYKKQPNLSNYLNLIDPICLLKTYNGPPFTQDFLFSYIQPSTGKKIYYCSIGLWQEIYKFFKKYNIEYDGLESKYFKRTLVHSFDEFKAIVQSWNLLFEPRPYQYEVAYKILQWNKSISELATRAGKTLMAYIIFRYSMEYLGVKKILMIVPSIQLVTQGFNDFNEYAEFFKTECIWSGGHLVESANLTIGTFQSLIKFLDKKSKKYNPDFFNQYDCVFVDETHRASADQIKTIISQPFMKNVKIGFGMTGTLPKERTIERFCICSLIGAKIQEISTAKLKSEKYISDIEIFQYRLNYIDYYKQIKLYIKCAEYALSNYIEQPDPKHPGKNKKVELPKEEQHFLLKHVKQLPFGMQQAKNNIYSESSSEIYKDIKWMELLKSMLVDSTKSNSLMIEKMMIHLMEERIDFLCNEIIPKCDKNTLILAHHTEYINYLYKLIEEKFKDNHIILKIIGEVNIKQREKIKNTLKENNNCILIASYGTMSTGITLANLCYGVLFESFKSDIVNNQSLGRGLGLSNLKDKYRLFDIVDCFNTKITNKVLLQGLARIKIYNDDFNQHKYNIINVNLGNNNVQYNESFRIAYDKYKEEYENQSNKKTQKVKKENSKKMQIESFIEANLFN